MEQVLVASNLGLEWWLHRQWSLPSPPHLPSMGFLTSASRRPGIWASSASSFPPPPQDCYNSPLFFQGETSIPQIWVPSWRDSGQGMLTPTLLQAGSSTAVGWVNQRKWSSGLPQIQTLGMSWVAIFWESPVCQGLEWEAEGRRDWFPDSWPAREVCLAAGRRRTQQLVSHVCSLIPGPAPWMHVTFCMYPASIFMPQGGWH